MSTPKQIRVLILLLLLAPLTFLFFIERDHRPDWNRTLVVGIYPYAVDADPDVSAWIEQLTLPDFRPIEDYLAEQAARHNLPLARPFEIRLGQPLQNAPPPPPRGDSAIAALRWAVSLRWWAWRFNDQGLDADIVIAGRYMSADTDRRHLHSIGMPSPRLALIKQIAADNQHNRNHVVMAHELLHTVAANDLYHPVTGQAIHPCGYAEPDREPRYPQPNAELMAMARPMAPNESIEPQNLAQTQIGPSTAREIGWTQAPDQTNQTNQTN